MTKGRDEGSVDRRSELESLFVQTRSAQGEERCAAAAFLHPAWLLLAKDERAEARHLLSDTTLRFEGLVARAVLAGDVAKVRALAAVPGADPMIRHFATDFACGSIEPLTRATVLRGEGWRELFIELGVSPDANLGDAASSAERRQELGIELTLRALDDAKALGFRSVRLAGIDPVAAVRCLPVAQHASRLGFAELEIQHPNGRALNAAGFDQLRRLAPRFVFSVHSHDPVKHDSVTRIPGSHGLTLDAIRLVLDAGLRARVEVKEFDAQHDDLDQTVAFLRKIGLASDAIAVDARPAQGREPTQERVNENCARGARDREAVGFTGSACIAYDGRVYPYVCSRHLVLGDLHERSLQAVLNDATPATAHLDASTSAWSERLPCQACRVRSALLLGPPSNVPFVSPGGNG